MQCNATLVWVWVLIIYVSINIYVGTQMHTNTYTYPLNKILMTWVEGIRLTLYSLQNNAQMHENVV